MRKELELFRDGKISKKELMSYLTGHCPITPVTVEARHVIHMLTLYQHNAIDKSNLMEWVNTLWFSDYFVYQITEQDTIASVLTRLEELEDEQDPLSPDIIESSITALKNNIALE